MKILLIDPPFYRFMGYYNRYFPVGLSYLATTLKKEGHEVLIYDADYNENPTNMDFSKLEENSSSYLESLKDNNHPIWNEMRKMIKSFSPRIVGVIAWTTFAASAFRVAEIVKGMNGETPVIMGGSHITLKYKEVLKICPDVDFLVRGEGEETLTELVETIAQMGDAKFNIEQLKGIKGISFRENGKIFHNPDRPFIKDLDTIPFPSRDLLYNKGSYDSEDMGLMMTSRGCPYGCTYCATSIWKRDTRYRSVDNVIEEIKLVMNRYGTTQFTFKDDSFTVNPKRVLEFCSSLMEEKIKIKWDCNTRVNLINEKLLRKMKEAGCNSIKIGIETGSERILKLMKKQTTLEQAREAAKLLKKVGIHWTGYFLMGLPTETKEDAYQTLNFLKELKPDFASYCTYEPFPGTELFEIGLSKGLTKPEQTLEDFYNTLPKHYYVKDIKRRIDTMSNEEFDALDKEMTEAFNRYNRNLIRLLSRLRAKIRVYIKEPEILWHDVRKFMAWY